MKRIKCNSKREEYSKADKEWLAKLYTENKRFNNTNPTKIGDEVMCFNLSTRCVTGVKSPTIS